MDYCQFSWDFPEHMTNISYDAFFITNTFHLNIDSIFKKILEVSHYSKIPYYSFLLPKILLVSSDDLFSIIISSSFGKHLGK